METIKRSNKNVSLKQYTEDDQEDGRHRFSLAVVEIDAADNDHDERQNETHWVVQNSISCYNKRDHQLLQYNFNEMIEANAIRLTPESWFHTLA